MIFKKNAYDYSPSGRILKYNINYDVERFAFVPESKQLFASIIDKVNDALNNFVGQRPYELNWSDIKAEYIKTGQNDVPLFASQYVFAKFLIEKRTDEKNNMQAMYLEIVAVINKEIELGRLPTAMK